MLFLSMKYKFILFASLLGQLAFAQTQQPSVYDRYPDGQTDYVGGNIQFYKELHQVFVDQGLQPCDNKDEGFNVKYVVYPDATIKFVKEDPEVLEKNKCTYDLIKASFKFLENWKPAEEGNVKETTMSNKWIFPDDLFSNYKEGYGSEPFESQADFKEGGINGFRNKLMQNVDFGLLKDNEKISMVVTFVINEVGEVTDVKILESNAKPKFNDMIIKSFAKVKGTWIPGVFRGKTVKSRFRFPLTFSVD